MSLKGCSRWPSSRRRSRGETRVKTDLVVGGFLVDRGRVLLVLHKKLGLWLPPGGHIEKGETPDAALKRELMEELGIEIEILNRNDLPKEGNIAEQLALPFYANVHSVGDHLHCCFYYLCTLEKRAEIVPNKSEINGFEWLGEKELLQEKVPGDVRNIGMMALGLAKKLKK